MVDDALTNLWVFLYENMNVKVSLILIEIATEIPILKSFRAKSKIKTFYLSLSLAI